MALSILAEALLRVEHKLDLLLEQAFAKGNFMPLKTMQFVGLQCPVCKRQVKYVIDIKHQVAKRKCGCSSNITPQEFPLSIGEANGTTTEVRRKRNTPSGNPPEDGTERKGR